MADAPSSTAQPRSRQHRAGQTPGTGEQALAEWLGASLLPHERPLVSRARLAEAANFTLGTLARREVGNPTVAIESVGGTAGERFMRVAIVNDDMPFLVDSVAGLVAERGLAIAWLAHPVLGVERDVEGRLVGFGEAERGDDAAIRRESIIYLETERGDARQRRALASGLATVLGDVRAAVEDWSKLRAALEAGAGSLADPEGAELLRWLNDGMLTHLGHVIRKRDGAQSGALGICRRSAKGLLAPASYERAFEWFEHGAGHSPRAAPLIVKANRLSNVHRRVPLDLFIVPVFESGSGDRGPVVALSMHAGVWTGPALAAPPDRIPRLRQDLTELMNRFAFDPAGHAGKGLVHALTALPHDLLIGFEKPDLERIATAMMSLVDRPRPKLALVQAPLGRHLFAFVWLPRDALSTDLRLRIQALLTARSGAQVLDWSLSVEGSTLALLRFVLDIRESGQVPDEAALDAELQTMVRGWSAAVEAELARGDGASRAAAIAARYAPAFPSSFRTDHGPAEAARDIRVLRSLLASSETPARLRGARMLAAACEAGDGVLRLKLYQREGTLPLSDAVPVLENFGFRVIEDIPTPLDNGRLGTIHDFLLALPSACPAATLLERAVASEAAIAAVLNGEAEDDPFNRLIVAIALEPRDADWLRAWFRYLRQAGTRFGVSTVVEALGRAPSATRALLALFRAGHDPELQGDRMVAAAAARESFREALSGVAAINEDRLLRLYSSLVEAIVRTNAFAPAGREALAFKLDPSRVPGLPKPVPWREIFVYSRRVMGVHLRAGPIARGGLRWSDRRDDFRTEVLGLMKAQRVPCVPRP
jgi:glutamate dehydrogenase